VDDLVLLLVFVAFEDKLACEAAIMAAPRDILFVIVQDMSF